MTITKQTKIGVLLGGLSGEREVSIRTGKAMAQGFRNRGYVNVVEIDVGQSVVEDLVREKIEVTAIALHGRFGEDGTIQGILEFLRIPYTGSGVTASAAAMDKVISKRLFEACQVRTPPWFVAHHDESLEMIREQVETITGFPAVAKPPCEGSTIGLSIVHRPEEIESAQKAALPFGDTVLWEQYIEGIELTVGFLRDEPLPAIEIVPKSGFYDYRSKYTKGLTEYYCPARVSETIALQTRNISIEAFAAVQAESFGRVDLRYSKEGEPFVLEVNTIPGMTETSLLPKAAAAAGISFDEMVEILLLEARLKTVTEK